MPTVSEKHADYYLQTMLYASIIRHDKKANPRQLPASPALLFIQQSSGDDYDPTITIGKDYVNDIADYEEDFTKRLSAIVAEIFEPDIPFNPTEDKSACEHCPYRRICGR